MGGDGNHFNWLQVSRGVRGAAGPRRTSWRKRAAHSKRPRGPDAWGQERGSQLHSGVQGDSASRLAAAWARSGLVGMDRSSGSDFWGCIVLPHSSPVQNKFLFPEARSQGNSLALPPRAVLGGLLVTDRDLMRTEALGVFSARGHTGLARRTFPTLHQCSGGNRWPQEDGLLGSPRFRISHGITLSICLIPTYSHKVPRDWKITIWEK